MSALLHEPLRRYSRSDDSIAFRVGGCRNAPSGFIGKEGGARAAPHRGYCYNAPLFRPGARPMVAQGARARVIPDGPTDSRRYRGNDDHPPVTRETIAGRPSRPLSTARNRTKGDVRLIDLGAE